MIRGFNCIVAAASATLVLATPTHAELTLCNRTSYRVDAAIGLEKRANVATRGWFRVDPGQCRQVVDGALDVDMVYLHARTPPVYGSAPLPQAGHAELCVRDATSRSPMRASCPISQQLRFTAAQPSRFAERADGQSGGGSRLRRHAGAARRHPAPAGDRRLRRLSDRRRAGRQDASRAGEIPQRPQAAGGQARRIFSIRCSPPPIRKAPASPGATTPNTP